MTPAQFEARVQALLNGGLRRAVLAELQETGMVAERLAKENATSRLAVRTGNLRRSIEGGGEVRGSDLVMYLRAGGGSKEVAYARSQELGAHLVPGPGKRFLAIPKGPALTASGVPRYSSPRQVSGLRFQPIRGGAMGMLVRDVPGRGKSGRGARSEIWFLLVRSATIKPKYYLFDALYQARDGLRDRIRGRLSRALGGA